MRLKSAAAGMAALALAVGAIVTGLHGLSSSVGFFGGAPFRTQGSVSRTAAGQMPRDLLQKIPISFQENRGQFGPDVGFTYGGPELGLLLGSREARATFGGSGSDAGASPSEPSTVGKSLDVQMDLVDGAKNVLPEGIERVAGTTNYLRGNDQGKWRTNIPSYSKVRYAAVYPGVDLVFHGESGVPEYDFIVASGADPGRVALSFDGATGLRLSRRGDLLIDSPAGELKHRRPSIYQVTNGRKVTVSGSFILRNGNEVAFKLGKYNRARTLVIDPKVEFANFLGGTLPDAFQRAFAVAVDRQGNTYVTGDTGSANFPTTEDGFQKQRRGYIDAFITKLDPGGSIVFSTYLGSTVPAESEFASAFSIAVDSEGAVVIAGFTNSRHFPISNAFQPLATSDGGGLFVTKLNPAGSGLEYSTYFGDASGVATGVAVDAVGRVFVTGNISSRITLPPSYDSFQDAMFQDEIAGGQDAFIAEFDPSAQGSESLVHLTYLGGTGYDRADSIAVAPSGEVAVMGATSSGAGGPFPTTPTAFQPNLAGAPDLFVSLLDLRSPPSEALLYSTYLGGLATEGDGGISYRSAGGVAVGGSGSIYVAAETSSPGLLTKSAFQSIPQGATDGIVAKFNPSGSGAQSLVYLTYLGGSGLDRPYSIGLDALENAFVAGQTDSLNFPVKNGVQGLFGGGSCAGPGPPQDPPCTDAFVTKLSSDGSTLVHSTFLGGLADDKGLDLAVTPAGDVHLTGLTTSRDFPTHPVRPQSFPGYISVFIARVVPLLPSIVAVAPAKGPVSGETPVVITGAGFNGSISVSGPLLPDVRSVKFGGVDAARFTVDSDGRLTAVSPAHAAGQVHVSVETSEGISSQTSADVFTYEASILDPPPPSALTENQPPSSSSSSGPPLITGNSPPGVSSLGPPGPPGGAGLPYVPASGPGGSAGPLLGGSLPPPSPPGGSVASPGPLVTSALSYGEAPSLGVSSEPRDSVEPAPRFGMVRAAGSNDGRMVGWMIFMLAFPVVYVLGDPRPRPFRTYGMGQSEPCWQTAY